MGDEGESSGSKTLISKLDVSDPLYLHPSDSSSLSIINVKLKGTENYRVWANALKLALQAKNKIGFINGKCLKSTDDEVLAIYSESAFDVWEELRDTYDKVDGSVIFGQEVGLLSQNGSSVSEYYHKLTTMWKQFDAMLQLPSCSCQASKSFNDFNTLIKLMQFFMGLDDVYQQVRTNLLTREPLPTVKTAFSIISREESHMSANVERCFEIVGYPQNSKPRFGKFNNQGAKSLQSNSNSSNSGKASTSSNSTNVSLTPDQISRLLGLLLGLLGDKNDDNNQTPNVGGVTHKENPSDWLGHPVFQVLDVLKNDLKLKVQNSSNPCEVCHLAKQHREPFPLSEHKTSEIGEAVWVYLLNTKNEVYLNLVSFFNMIKTQFGKTIKAFRSDNGTEFVNTQMQMFVNNNVISSRTNPDDEEREPRHTNPSEQPPSTNNHIEGGVEDQQFVENEQHNNLDSSPSEGVSSGGTNDESNSPEGNVDPIGQTNMRRSSRESRLPKNLHDYVVEGFVQSKSDYSLFIKSIDNVLIVLLVYVDDIVITGNNVEEIGKIKGLLRNKFLIKDLGILKYFLGIEVLYSSSGVCLNQRKYCVELLAEFGLTASKPVNTPIEQNHIVTSFCEKDSTLLENITGYQKLVGKLIYLSHTRPDISYSIQFLSQFMHSPTSSHLKLALRLLRYLKKSPGRGIKICKEGGYELKAYADSDWANA
ncbi:uncharacterized protein LOC143545969 [Bidens hawaiensis]|uniref:uncharacterized protein LOC143545969 n=1 Tax=Bidens hawaiensis TaxID=980011 RepID=UPI00404B926B